MSRLVIRLAWLLIPLSLSACGGSRSVGAISVSCDGGTEVFGATSVNVLGDPVNGRPTISYADPANPGQTSTIAVPPHGRCKISLESKV